MKVEILDLDVFGSLDPENVSYYLRGQDWIRYGTAGPDDDIEIWDRKTKKEVFRVRIPQNRSFVDFDESLGIAVKTIANATGRSQLEILDDLETVGIGDVVRLSTYDPRNPASTTIPLLVGVDLFERAKKLAAAAALSAESPKPVYSTYRSKTVTTYLDTLRLGQTEQGSYRIKLISPLPVQQRLFKDEGSMPFSRATVITLMDGLDALSHLTKNALKKGYQFEEFNEAVPSGVSANMCEALVASTKSKSLEAPIEVSVTWSDVMDLRKTSVHEVDFDPTQLAFIGMAARDFRERSEEETVLEGFVVALSRESPNSHRDPPRITLAAIVEDRLRRVHIAVLVPAEYDLAIQAHGNNSILRVRGTLKQSGRFLWLEEARNFEIGTEDS